MHQIGRIVKAWFELFSIFYSMCKSLIFSHLRPAAGPRPRKAFIISTLLDSNQRVRVLQTLALPLGERCENVRLLSLAVFFLAESGRYS